MRWIWVFLVACDPVYSLHVDVHDRGGQPIARARVSLVCDGHRKNSRVTNKRGDGSIGGVGTPGRECVIRVQREGEQAITYPLIDFCSDERWFGGCVTAVLHAVVP